uniref:t-SNARE coiled-coil homology domain-containing protein n=1 Tax=Aplanochytrium stocchinoi TaxID=215587 RepID=A0A6S8B106_9STRA|mmetsp:Transcript_9608/g.11962  ORF Transcript_9608/g.11962 Transcript_9608/m.11962 type:complete len:306 (+) Transcript_9608:218-1135(+)|eukprot:CAMPEP_0204827350 /NCGR_PEP_ID=MMETSP1346-20131115/4833_1 /ASSEMBLY_ACC=CAM_ASM_000771 /TAXON_ID=215587 /ORGANISM="Aplanochytrium stocchinoi, Strain GSBS06" /LENGTH=305 /DNA_ID=CAMNT_0051955743 /DNA_START=436 /DNA_END=1353 /DNA_ORIENTATION=+
MAGGSRKEKRLRDIDELLERLSEVQKHMPDENEGKKKVQGDKMDAFQSVKSSFIAKLLGVKKTIREMQEAQQKVTTKTTDQIAKQQHVRSELKELNNLQKEMEALQSKERRKKKSKLSEQELKERDDILRQFQIQLLNLKQASTKGYINANIDLNADLETGTSGAGIGNLHATSDFLNDSGTFSGTGGSYAGAEGIELTELQKESLLKIEERDKGFDQTIDTLGQAVDRAGELAKAIGGEAEKQNALLEKTDEKIEQAQSHLQTVNMKMKDQLVESGCGFERICINLMCFIIFMGIIGVIVNLVG